jgi:hypothetical protein
VNTVVQLGPTSIAPSQKIMVCKSHEIFFPTCGHIFRCEEPTTIIDPSSYDPLDPRRKIEPHKPHPSIPAHPCNKHLPRTISSADRSPVGSWTMCAKCEGGPKLPDCFKIQKFSCAEYYREREWETQLEELRRYYKNEIIVEAQIEWCCEETYGRDWEIDTGGSESYAWEKKEGIKKSCRIRSAEQQLRENKLSDL